MLSQAVTAAVSPGSQVLTDGWNGYATLKAKGYRHEVVRDRAIVGANLLPRANRVASLLQRWLLGTHQGAVAAAHLDTIWTNSRSGSTSALPARAVGCFNGWSSKPWHSRQFAATS